MHVSSSFGSYFKRLDKNHIKFHVAFFSILVNALIFNLTFFASRERIPKTNLVVRNFAAKGKSLRLCRNRCPHIRDGKETVNLHEIKPNVPESTEGAFRISG